jgi:hypothetical protein
MKDYDVYWLSEHLMASTTKLREVEKQKTQETVYFSITVFQFNILRSFYLNLVIIEIVYRIV